MIEELLYSWATGLIDRAPELAILGIIVVDLRTQLKACLGEQRELLDALLKRVISDD